MCDHGRHLSLHGEIFLSTDVKKEINKLIVKDKLREGEDIGFGRCIRVSERMGQYIAGNDLPFVDVVGTVVVAAMGIILLVRGSPMATFG